MEPYFSCCHRYAECDYGRKECCFAETKPDMKERCRCYDLKRTKNLEVIRGEEEIFEEFTAEVSTDDNQDPLSLEQLSLF
ncbi:hypothetical protein AWM68_17575 [Fictibacillus phosphorivorans]|uniref:Uncharacterized protein n=1 Tax=Fictibacillus phosphorivorans TaxID=1221500 RepID=A0A163S1Z4_9BACL|nr:hypothetical protein [Fictibacillus phosphorivorans]KZE67982.1 hypothetical protein AWM68_17575 [Fictibacillus phosphorivorans]